MKKLLATLLFTLLSVTPAFAVGPYFWASPSGTHNVTGADGFCSTIASADTATDPGVYGTMQAAAFCKKFSGIGGIIIKGSLGAYSSSNHVLDFYAMGAIALLSGTDDAHRTVIMGAPGETTPVINIPCWIQDTNNSGANRNWRLITNVSVNGASGTGCTAEITIYGDDNRIDNVNLSNCWNVCIFFSGYPPSGLIAERNEATRNKGAGFGRDGAGLLIYNEGMNTLITRNECTSGQGGCIQSHNGNPGLTADNAIIAYNYSHGVTKQTQTGFSTTCRAFAAIDGRNVLMHHNIADGLTCVSSGSTAGWGIEAGYDPGVNVTLGYNNTIFSYVSNGIQLGDFGASTGSIITNNLLLENGAAGVGITSGTTGVTQTTNVNSGLVSTYLTSYASPVLKAGSAAINAGTAISGLAFNGSAPDQGAMESFTYASAVINDVTVDVSLGMNLFTPVQNIVAAQWTVGCSGGANCGTPVVATAIIKPGTSAVVRLTLSGLGGAAVCEVGQTWTVTATATAATDSALIGNLLNQPITAFSAQAVVNSCTGGGVAAPGTPYVYYLLDENTLTNANDETVNNLDGTLTGGPTWVAGKHVYGVNFANDTVDRYIAIPYGNAVNPDTQSLTACVGVKPDAGLETGAQKVFFASPNGASQRFYLGWVNGTWGMGIQSSGFATNVDFPVAAGWTRVCLRADSGTNIATLFVNGVKGTSAQSVKAFTSYALAGNFRLGNDATNTINYGGSTVDDPKIYQSALTDQNIADDFTNWNPSTPAPTGTFTQVAHQFTLLRKKASGAIDNFGAQSATVPVIAGGAFGITTQTDCTGANCTPIAQKLRFSCNNASAPRAGCNDAALFLEVPDNIGTAGQIIFFYGMTTDSDILSGTVTCCLTGALTANNGAVQFTSDAVPNFDLTQNASVVQRRMMRLGTGALSGDSICFKEYNQDGNAFATSTPSAGACILVIGVTGALGF